MTLLEVVSGVLESIGAPWALIGGRAVGARGYPRMTLDYDFMTSDARVLDPDLWIDVAKRGVSVDPRKGDSDDPLAGVVHLGFPDGEEADVVLAKWDWEVDVLRRAEPLDLGGRVVPVPLTSDLILMKLAAGGPIDLQDVVALLAIDPERLRAEVDEKVGHVSPDVSETWKRIRHSGNE